MGAFIDETGNRYGKWKVIKRTGPSNGGKTLWQCRCDCGAIHNVMADKLRRHKSRGCKMCQDGALKEIRPGTKFGDWTVLKRGPNYSTRAQYWCQCKCGAKRLITGTLLRTSMTATSSCKRCACRRRFIDMTGKHYGLVTVLRRGPTKRAKKGTVIYWWVRCECGKEWLVQGSALRDGRIKSCGGCLLSRQIGRNWKGGVRMTWRGYRDLWKPEHPDSKKSGYIFEHRLVMSDFLGRPLTDKEVVHHRNGNRQDNGIENLELCVIGSKNNGHPPGQRKRDLRQPEYYI